MKKHITLVVALLATLVRYYDYAIFGLSASLLSEHFTPTSMQSNAEQKMLVFFMIFSVSTLARPCGSLIFGKIGDKFGRITSIKIATLIASLSTLGMGIAPGFSYIGWYAILLLTVLRMCFLISLSGEVDAIKLYVTEKFKGQYLYFASGVVSCVSQLGVLSASLMFYITVSFNDIEWLWRASFILGGVVGFIIFLFRSWLQESEQFLAHKRHLQASSRSLSTLEIIKENKSSFLIAVVINGILGGGYHFLIIFYPSFISSIAGIMSIQQAILNNTFLIILYASSCLLAGYIANKINIENQLTGIIVLAICVALGLELLVYLRIFSIWLYYLLVFIMPFYSIPCAIKSQLLFPIEIRMRMYSFAHSIGSVVLSSTTPLVCMLIWRNTLSVTLVIAYFILQLILLCLSVMCTLYKT